MVKRHPAKLTELYMSLQQKAMGQLGIEIRRIECSEERHLLGY
jgi:hypothetical protein